MREQITEPSIRIIRAKTRPVAEAGEIVIRRTDTTRGLANHSSHSYIKPATSRKNGTFTTKQRLVSKQSMDGLPYDMSGMSDMSDQTTVPVARRIALPSNPILIAPQIMPTIPITPSAPFVIAIPEQQEQMAQQQQRRWWSGVGSVLIHTPQVLWGRVQTMPFLRTLLALIGSFLLPLALYHSSLATQVGSVLYSLDFDPERVVLLNQLLAVLLGTMLTGILFRRRISTILGATIYFVSLYLVPFIIQVQHPSLGPGGVKQVLIPSALVSVAIGLLALGFLCAALGALIGSAYSEMVLVTGGKCLQSFWQALRQRTLSPLRQAIRPLLSVGVGLLILLAVLVGSGQANTLLTYGLTTNLYKSAPIGHNVPVGTVERISFVSPALGNLSRNCYIYLPPSYNKNTSERYPVFYLLHGSPGQPSNWLGSGINAQTIENTLLALGKTRETIIVGPDGNGPKYRFSEWANSFDGLQKMEDFIAIDLVHFIDTHYRTLADPADRSIGGNSTGGYGAVNIAMHHPDVFGHAASLGGYFKAATSGPVFFGPNNNSYLAYNSPLFYIATPGGLKAAQQIQIIIAVGTKDSAYSAGLEFYRALVAHGLRPQLIVTLGGHSWSVWRVQMGSIFSIFEPPTAISAT